MLRRFFSGFPESSNRLHDVVAFHECNWACLLNGLPNTEFLSKNHVSDYTHKNVIVALAVIFR